MMATVRGIAKKPIRRTQNAYGQNKKGGAMMLHQLKPNEIAKILAIEGGHNLRQKLTLRGIAEGSFLRVISCHGPVTVEVDRNIVSIGRGMARKIRVMRI